MLLFMQKSLTPFRLAEFWAKKDHYPPTRNFLLNWKINNQEVGKICIGDATAAIPVTRFGRIVFAHSPNLIAVSKALVMMESNLIQTQKNTIHRVEWC